MGGNNVPDNLAALVTENATAAAWELESFARYGERKRISEIFNGHTLEALDAVVEAIARAKLTALTPESVSELLEIRRTYGANRINNRDEPTERDLKFLQLCRECVPAETIINHTVNALKTCYLGYPHQIEDHLAMHFPWLYGKELDKWRAFISLKIQNGA